MLSQIAILILFFAVASLGLAETAGDAELTQAYKALAQKDYDAAADLFRNGLEKQPQNIGAHKDYAYTLLKMGDNTEARNEFEKALHLNASDETAALEYAFLCYDTKMPIEARRTFDRWRHRGSAATRATAEQAFENIDKPLAAGIDRWREALVRSANPADVSTFSAHWELGQLAEQRDDLPLAAEQYEICRQMKPNVPQMLLDLARVWQQLNRVDDARGALLAASRGKESRSAELAREQLGSRYPYPYEFVKALRMDPANVVLRRELAYLYLAMHKEPEALQQFEQVLTFDPKDGLTQAQMGALRHVSKRPEPVLSAAAKLDAKTMGQKSLAAGYVRDAIKYFQLAHEQDPDDAEIMLKLGWAYNLAKDDADALRWFDRARHSANSLVAVEANRAFRNIEHGGQPLFTAWILPMYSSRWKDGFTYGQIKRIIPLPWQKKNPLFSLYLSTRFMGDAKSGLPGQSGVLPQYLSENSFIFGAGIASRTWHHVTAWGEAGEAVSYLPNRHDVGVAVPDYRGGLNFAKGFGTLLGSNRTGLFYETTADAVYVSRFDKDWLFYSQHRTGYTFRAWGGSFAQALINANYTHDVKNQYWANTIELGPGLRLHFPWMPSNVYFAGDFLRGIYTNNIDNPRRPNFWDARVSVWYAVSR